MNKLIEFLHDKEAKSLLLGNNGFMAKRPAPAIINIRYEGKVICKITPYFIQHTLEVLPPASSAECDRLTELFELLGMPRLRVKWYTKRGYTQRLYKGNVVAEYGLREPCILKVNL